MAIIKTLEEFGRAMDAGEEIEAHVQGDAGWIKFEPTSWFYSTVLNYVHQGRLRTKPKTKVMYVNLIRDPIFYWVYETEERARKAATNGDVYLAIAVPVTIEDVT